MAMDGNTLGDEIFQALGLEPLFDSFDEPEKTQKLEESKSKMRALGSAIITHIQTNGVIKVNVDNLEIDDEGISTGGAEEKIGQIDNAGDVIGTIE